MPSGTPDYYRILGVAADADHETIRKAYLEAARRWHPDALESSASDGGSREDDDRLKRQTAKNETAKRQSAKSQNSVEAEGRIRQINEAWHVLGSAPRRRAYDARRAVKPISSAPVDGGVRVDEGVTRIDPRLVDPTALASHRYAQQDDISLRHGMIVRALPLVVILTLLGGILVATAYAARGRLGTNGGTADGSEADVTAILLEAPSLGSGIEGGDCVSVASGPSLIERPCDDLAAGKVVAAHRGDGLSCPADITIREVELTNGWTACLGEATG